jgi:predicted small secreted protein
MKQMNRMAMVLLALYVLAGCNTVNGMGKDIKAGGQAIEDVSKKK